MDQTAFSTAKSAYQKGDWTLAVAALNVAKEPGEISGTIDHLLGNSLMKLGRYREAAQAYASALEDSAYGKVGALSCNQGRALLATGDVDGAIEALRRAVQDTEYATPYKAQIALGNALLRAGNAREAGIAFRNAAIDELNPDPAVALSKLGTCFMQLGRPVDAVEALRTALDFSNPSASQGSIYAQLGNAYVAANRMPEAFDAFNHASQESDYELTAEEQASFNAARKAVAALSGVDPTDTEGLLAAGAAGSSSFDPLDPLGASGEIMPSPEDTGFFEITEEDLLRQDRDRRKMRRKNRHTGLKVFFTLLLLALLAAAACAWAYWKGYGWPTQQQITQALFEAVSNGNSFDDYVVDGLSASAKEEITDLIPLGSTVEIEGIDQDMTSSAVRAKATLPGGGEQIYTLQMRRDGLGWKVASVELVFPATEDGGAVLSGDASSTSTGTVEEETEVEAETETEAEAETETETEVETEAESEG